MDKEKLTLIPMNPAALEMKSDIFMLVYDEYISKYGLKGAYEKIENEHEKVFGKRKYSCYDSFRQIRKRAITNGTLLHPKKP